uniref:Uncharacterized protein n=1 Tax=Coccolithus braarudii TaxID=221442 RepID=A0A7S0LH24_9EUKA|mmetsp:Transcript_40062/g.85529  ORF Transcript_40062/g.85529 Transcript_40062/m.85529 type:complete len:788 (+) Transcript_40062:187-2550(+)
MELVVKARVRIHSLATQPALNGQEGTLVKFDSAQNRWHVLIANRAKGLALRVSNLELVNKAATKLVNEAASTGVSAALALVDELVRVRKSGRPRVALVIAQDSGRLQLCAERDASDSWWADEGDVMPLERAAEDTIPTDFLFCDVEARDTSRPRAKFERATVVDVRTDTSAKLRFRVRFDGSGEHRWLRLQDLRGLQAVHAAPVSSVTIDATAGPSVTASRKRKADAVEATEAAAPPPVPRKGETKAVTFAPSEPGERTNGSTGPDASTSTSSRRKRPVATDAFEAALDALQPSEVEEGNVDGAERIHVAGGADGPATAQIPVAAPARDPRLQGFRIGGQAESAEERGEGWCGPWSTARALLDRRAAAKAEREAELGGQPEAPITPWLPARDVNTPRRSRVAAAVPSLQNLAIALVVEHIDAVSSFGILSPSIVHAIASALCKERKFTGAVLPLFAEPDVPLTELVVPDCHALEPADLFNALQPHLHDASRLGVLHLGFCGKCLTPSNAALLERAVSLHTLHLGGCFRLSDAALASLLSLRGGGLSSLHLSANSQCTGKAVEAIATHCPQISRLALEHLEQLPSVALLPLRKLGCLERLSLRGMCMLGDEVLVDILTGCAASLSHLCLADCSLLTDASLLAVPRLTASVRDLDLGGVELLTDAAVKEIASGLPDLSRLSLRLCVQLSDDAVVAVAEACKGSLSVLSLNKLPAIGELAIKALADHCSTSLTELDLSWCRGVSDQALGHLVDRCEKLETLKLWGCTQLTKTFYHGHAKDDLRVVGRAFV